MTEHNLQVEHHPLAPFLPSNGKLLMLGSFPPPQTRWKMDFYYPNFQNDMWRILGLCFYQNKNHFIDLQAKNFYLEKIIDFLNEKGIGIYDTAEQVIRLKANASDKFLQIEKVSNIKFLLSEMPNCHSIVTTGDKATDTLLLSMPEGTEKPKIEHHTNCILNGRNLTLYRMPSSSRAYPLALEKKAEAYLKLFNEIGLL